MIKVPSFSLAVRPLVSCVIPLLSIPLLCACAQGEGKRQAQGVDLSVVNGELPPEPIEDELPFAETPVGKHGALSVQGPDLVDSHGNRVQLKGISSMWLNMESTGYATSAKSLKWMRDNWNISLFRAAMGAGDDRGGPSPGGYLDSPTRMTNFVERIVENATKLGVYVIIDWHDHVAELHQDKAQAFFAEMAERYKDNDNVLYEVFNEPVPGIRNPTTFQVERAFTWKDDIKPYHEALVDTIRAHDPDGVIILGTQQWSQLVDEAAMDPLTGGKNLMYTLHFYSCTHVEWLREKARTARGLGLPIFVTEWGATAANGGTGNDTEVCVDESNLWHDWMNANSISWAAWKLDDCADISCLLKTGTAVGGNWTGSLHGHASHVVEKLLNDVAPSDEPNEDPSMSDAGAEPGPIDTGMTSEPEAPADSDAGSSPTPAPASDAG